MGSAPKKPPLPPLVPIDVFSHAMRFFLACDRLHRASMENEIVARELAQPILVLTAFASELFLKAQIAAEGAPRPKSHDLRELFDLLSPGAQTIVQGEWDKVMTHREADTLRLEVTLGMPLPRDLRAALDLSRKSFEELRYVYETKSANSVIGFFPIALREALFVLHPEWARS